MNVKRIEFLASGMSKKFHADGKSTWSIGLIRDGFAHGYWEWFRVDGTIKRSGHFNLGTPVGEWITYDKDGKRYKITKQKEKNDEYK